MAEILRLVPRETEYGIVSGLRELAKSYEDGEREMPTAFVFVTEGEEGLSTGVLGLTDEIRAVGLLTVGAQYLGHEATE